MNIEVDPTGSYQMFILLTSALIAALIPAVWGLRLEVGPCFGINMISYPGTRKDR